MRCLLFCAGSPSWQHQSVVGQRLGSAQHPWGDEADGYESEPHDESNDAEFDQPSPYGDESEMGEESAEFGQLNQQQLRQRQQPTRMRLRGLGDMHMQQPQTSALQEQGPSEIEGEGEGQGQGQGQGQSQSARGSSGIEQCAYRSSRVCRMTDWLQQIPDWSRMQSAPVRLFAASNEPHEISCVKETGSAAATGDQLQQQQQQQQPQQQSPQGSQQPGSMAAGGAFSSDKCYAPDVYTCANGQLLLKVSAGRHESRLAQARKSNTRTRGIVIDS